MLENNKISEAVDLFWRETGVREDGPATCCYTLPWEQRLYNKKRAEEILNSCTKDELIDYILYRGKNKMEQVCSTTPQQTYTIRIGNE